MNPKNTHLHSHLRTRIKICGITRLEDALAAIDAGADALGFVFYGKSPRYIKPKAAAEIIKLLPPFVTAVGLFVNANQDEILNTVNVTGIHVVQLHGDETSAFCAALNMPVIKALPISTSHDLDIIPKYQCTILLDARAPEGVYGGTGQSFDWSLLASLEYDYPLILAGGLKLENIVEALLLREWFAVDVSSGVEQSKGIKSKRMIQQFCKKVHEFNGKV